MSLAREYDELGIGNLTGKLVSGVPVSFIRGAVLFVIPNENERLHPNLFQAIRVVMLLAENFKIDVAFIVQGRLSDAR